MYIKKLFIIDNQWIQSKCLIETWLNKSSFTPMLEFSRTIKNILEKILITPKICSQKTYIMLACLFTKDIHNACVGTSLGAQW